MTIVIIVQNVGIVTEYSAAGSIKIVRIVGIVRIVSKEHSVTRIVI